MMKTPHCRLSRSQGGIAYNQVKLADTGETVTTTWYPASRDEVNAPW